MNDNDQLEEEGTDWVQIVMGVGLFVVMVLLAVSCHMEAAKGVM